jgi:hypothetical protein
MTDRTQLLYVLRRRRSAAMAGIERQLGLLQSFTHRARDGFAAVDSIQQAMANARQIYLDLEELERIAKEVRK